LVDGGGLVGGVNDGFQSGFSFFVGHLIFNTRWIVFTTIAEKS
jgi:hypothetical protein